MLTVAQEGTFNEIVKDVDAIEHVTSPVTESNTDTYEDPQSTLYTLLRFFHLLTTQQSIYTACRKGYRRHLGKCYEIWV